MFLFKTYSLKLFGNSYLNIKISHRMILVPGNSMVLQLLFSCLEDLPTLFTLFLCFSDLQWTSHKPGSNTVLQVWSLLVTLLLLVTWRSPKDLFHISMGALVYELIVITIFLLFGLVASRHVCRYGCVIISRQFYLIQILLFLKLCT